MSSWKTNSQRFYQKIRLAPRSDGSSKSTHQGKNASLKTIVRKQLLLRLAAACILISIVLASFVFFLEFQRFGNLVNNRAGVIAARFNDEIRDLLDDPTLTEKTALRNKLKMLSIIGKLNPGIGQVIYAGIYDLDNNAIVIEKDLQSTYLNEVDAVMKSRDQKLPKTSQKVYKYRYINGKPHIQLTYPLTNSNNKQAAVIEGLFAISSKVRNEVLMRIVRSAFEAIGIVILTTLILYPIIITLMGQLSRLADNLLVSNIETLQVLGSAIAKRDSDTDIHNYRVTIYSVTLAEAVGLRHNLIRGLIKGAFLHDAGKIGISDKILLKPGKLTKKEFKMMEQHVIHGIDIVEGSDWLKDAIHVVGFHHEKFNGEGYPYGLKGESIPIIARIFTIADVFDALTSMRPYKEAMSFEDAMAVLEEGRGTQFDPTLLDTFIPIAKSLYEIIANSSDEILREKLEHLTRKYLPRVRQRDKNYQFY
jgi:HD-GYP domain-containing protein (c-di-GMP phosphodiesterase class II)